MVRMPHWPVPWHQPQKHTLEQIKLLLSALQDPHRHLPPVIHVAGTNGKGSTIAYLHAIFAASGYKVHVYTSPHLQHFNERIVIASNYINDLYLFSIMERTRIAAERLNIVLTFFEATTVAAFLAFAENSADVLLLETGLGGRLDATNVVEDPIANVVTTISYDHMEYLGPTLEFIAREKAGIIKQGAKSIISLQPPNLYNFFINYTEQMHSSSMVYEHDFGIEKLAEGFMFTSHALTHHFSTPNLPGDHQIINSGAAIATCIALREKFDISPHRINQGISEARWQARLEKINLFTSKYQQVINFIIKSSRINDEHDLNYIPQIWIDGAHNVGGAAALSLFIKENLSLPTYLILGMTKNRDARSFAAYFANIITQIFTVEVVSEPKSYSAETLSLFIGDVADVTPIAADSLIDSLILITNINRTNNIHRSNVVITGSLFLAADFYNLA